MITSITKRNGKTAPFEPQRIRKAIYSAFWEFHNQNAKRDGGTPLPKGTTLSETEEREIETITNLVVETAERKNLKTVEEIETLVEDTIWSREHKEVSKLYIGYRILHQKKREESERKYKISITKSNGEKVAFQIEPLEAAIKAACQDIKDVSEKALLSEAENSLYDGVKTSEITEAMIQAARSFIEREPAYSFVAGRLLLQKLADESLGELGFEYKSSQIPVPYQGYFQSAINQGVKENLLDEKLLGFDLDKLAKALVPERDLELQYMGLKTLADRYLIKSRQSRNRIELPQNFFMRVAMGLALNEKDKNARAIEFYNVLSQRLGMSSTPTLFNAGTTHSQLSSCYLYKVDDNIESILLNGIANNGFLSKWAGGLGGSWTSVRANGAYIGGTNGESMGIIPFLKIHNAQLVAVNQGGKRRGSGCAYLETWHMDIEEFLELRKETGDERRRCHDMNTANWVPDLFMKRVIEDGHWWLFSPDKTPDLHKLFGKEFEERYAQYEAEAEAGVTTEQNEENGLVKRSLHKHPLHPCKRISAVALWKKMLTALFETGHPWITFKDSANIRNPQDHCGVIHSSNLCCMAQDQRVVTGLGMFTVGELYKAGTPNVVMGRQGSLDASKMLLPRPNAPMVKIVTNEGYSHKVTPDHKVGIIGGIQKEAQNLEEGDLIELQQTEGLFGENAMTDEALLAGFIAADGGFSENYAYIDIWENKTLHLAPEIEAAAKRVLEKYDGDIDYDNHESGRPSVAARRKPTFQKETQPSTIKRRLQSSALKMVLEHLGMTAETKLQVPDFVWKGTKETIQAYIRGAILCDGSPQATNEITTVQWGSVSQSWLEEIQILLINLGIKTSITPMREAGENLLPDGKGGHQLYSVQALYRLLLTSQTACKLLEGFTGLGKERNHIQYLSNLQNKKGYAQKMHATFSHLEPLPNEDAYCLQVDSEEHLWVVNGMLTRNTEIFLNTSSSKICAETGEVLERGETAVCNLSSVNLVNHIQEGKLNKRLLKETVTTLMRMLDNVVDINYYPVPEAKNSNLQHRPVGLGIMGVHTTLQMLGIPYDSQEAIEFSDVSQELISLFAIEASSDIAKEKGAYSTFSGSKWDRGIFPKDTLDLLAQERGEAYMLADRSSAYPEEWDRVKAKVKAQGMRNSNTMAIAPTATIANICGVSEGIMPEKAPVSRKENLSGSFPQVNPLLIEKLKENGLWNDTILEKIKMSEGSIQSISEIPEEIRNLFKSCFEIHPSFLIECASRRQKWIDQGQSLNLFADQPSGQFLSTMYRLAWLKGLKATYYLRTVSASQKEKSSVEVQKLGNTTGVKQAEKPVEKKAYTEPEIKACSIEAMRRGEECEACQ